MIGPQRMPKRIIGRRAALMLTAASLLAGCQTLDSIFSGDIFEDIFVTKKVPLPGMYFSRNGKRYRSLGCMPITKPVSSNASSIPEIIEELLVTRVSERAGRAQDHHERNAMQKLRAKGFM